jgi:membrane-bound lytic murein transglycosylase B
VRFSEFLADVRATARALGISASTLDAALDGLEPAPAVIERDRAQPEAVLTLDAYVTRRLSPDFVRTARQMRSRHGRLLRQVSARYQVPSSVLVAVWGLESNFGRFSGLRPTVQALATLAWEGRRGGFFLGELFDALRIIDRGDIELAAMRGSWAGAMGQPQFMPSIYLTHAQDFDRDGRRDIWASLPDVFASMASYLRHSGWRPGERWGRQVRLPAGGTAALADAAPRRESGCRAERELSVRLPLARWRALGVVKADGGALPTADLDASLLRAEGRAFLVYGNYEALLNYNCANAYALAAGLLADRLAP